MISRPGLQYDETLFVNAATLRIPGNFLLYSIHHIPLMVFPYIGAFKSWLYDPLFAVFGTSAVVIRLPVILIVSAGLVLLYVAVRDLVNRPVAVLAFAALCFDNSVFWLTRDDVGPSAIEFFLKCAALFCAARVGRAIAVASERDSRDTQLGPWLLVLLATLALGVFNKLNFIWTVNAVAAVSLLVVLRNRALLRSQWRAAAVWFGGLAVIYAGFGAYYLGDHIGSVVSGPGGSSIGQPFRLFSSGMEAILSGTWFYTYALAPLASRIVVVWVVLALVAGGALASIASRRSRNPAVAGLALATFLIALQNLLTAQATGGWHYISIYPFVTILAAYGAYVTAQALLRRERAVYVALVCFGAATLAYDGTLITKYFGSLSSREPTNAAWSPSVYRLSRDLHGVKARIFTADWGISNPLFALHPSRDYTELAFALERPTTTYLKRMGDWFASIPGPKLFVTHPSSKLTFPHANANLFTAAGAHLHLATTVNGRDGKPVYEIYAYR